MTTEEFTGEWLMNLRKLALLFLIFFICSAWGGVVSVAQSRLSTGTLLMYTIDSTDEATELTVYTIDPVTGEHTFLLRYGYPSRSSLSFDFFDQKTQKMYLVEVPLKPGEVIWGKIGRLLSVDVNTGDVTVVYERLHLWYAHPYPEENHLIVGYFHPEQRRPLPIPPLQCILDLLAHTCDELTEGVFPPISSENVYWLDSERFLWVDNGGILVSDLSTETTVPYFIPPDQCIDDSVHPQPVPDTNQFIVGLDEECSLAETRRFALFETQTSKLTPLVVPDNVLSDFVISPDGEFMLYRDEVTQSYIIGVFNSSSVLWDTGLNPDIFGSVSWLPDSSGIIGTLWTRNYSPVSIVAFDIASGETCVLSDTNLVAHFISIE